MKWHWVEKIAFLLMGIQDAILGVFCRMFRHSCFRTLINSAYVKSYSRPSVALTLMARLPRLF